MELEKVVREFLIESGRTEHRFVQALQFGISCLRELNYDVTGSPSIKILTVNDNDTVDLPNDYLNYIRLGFTDGRGEFRELGRNKDIALNRNLNDCGQRGQRYDSTQKDTGLFPYYASDYNSNHFRNGESVGRFYGAGGGNNSNGGFKIDKNYSQIQLDCYAGGSTITLEYLSDPNKAEGQFDVHPFSVETVKSWIDWKINANNPNVPVGYSEQKRLLYSRNKKLLFARMSSMSVQDMLQSFRKGNKASPKF
tara:strand:+ start:14272 stop:15027 length:756 start_codon:yes stop_codon:yes gene_type:complete